MHPAEALHLETECFLNLKQRFCSRGKIHDSGKTFRKRNIHLKKVSMSRDTQMSVDYEY